LIKHVYKLTIFIGIIKGNFVGATDVYY